MAYALPAAAIALLVFITFGGSGTRAETIAGADSGPSGLIMLVAPMVVLALLLRRRHLVEGLFAGIGCAVVIGLLSRRFGIVDLFSIDADNFIASGLLLDGMRRAVGVSIFTLLLMGLVGGVEASGFLKRLVHRIEDRAPTAARAEWWIFGSVSAATLLTTHSAVAILTIGPLARDVGSAAGVEPYRRANILDVAVCTYPFLLPFFIPTILAASMTGGFNDLARVSPWEAGLHNVHSWGLLVVLLVAIATGWGRSRGDHDGSNATP